MQTHIAAATIFLIFGLTYTFVLQPTILYLYGLNTPPLNENDKKNNLKSMDPHSRSLNAPHAELNQKKNSNKRSSFVLFVLPFYGIGVMVYFVYTLIQLFGYKKQIKNVKKEKMLKDYYRNFKYNIDKQKFQMDGDSSDEDHSDRLRRLRAEGNIGSFDWSATQTKNENGGMVPDIYRSITGLPRDLEYLLKKVDENNLDDKELHRLQDRLGQMEDEMTRLLRAVSTPISSNPNTQCEKRHADTGTHLNHRHHQAKLAANQEEKEEEEALFSATED